MRASIKAGACALAFALAACGSGDGTGTNLSSATGQEVALKQIAAPDNGDWTETVSQTPEGGFRMGNPNAPVKLVEYASITCPHCAEFEEQGVPTLRDRYVRSGQVSWEYRPLIVFPSDPGIFMLLRCQGPGPFFRLSGQLYADQRNWVTRLQSTPPEQLQQIEGMPPIQRAAAMVRLAGLDQFFRQRGMPEARMNSCLADDQNLQQLGQISQLANQEGVTGTPSFFINGTRQEAGRWSELAPLLRNAVGG
jgi:protein-disulfide isomerase